QLLQGQQDLRSAVDTNNASLRTLVQQQVDSVNHLTTEMSSVEKAVQEVQASVGKLSQQLTDMQNLLQSIDGKVSGGAPTAAPGGTNPGALNPGNGPGPGAGNQMPSGNGSMAAMAPISADTLYQNALRDYNTGKYDLAHQEFSDYIRNFPTNDLASNAQFYLGEIAYAQGDYKDAIPAYDTVL